MPKVKDEYITDKRNFILECTGEILKEKPLYLITMRDIIKKAGFSQGVIYRYYANLDEIYVDYINKHTNDCLLEQRVDSLVSSEQTETDILAGCLMLLGEYIEELVQSVVGKTFFELVVLYSGDPEKRNAIFPRLKLKQSLEYAQRKTMEYAMCNVAKGVFQPQLPIPSILRFVSVFIDGIAHNAVYNTVEDGDRDSGPEAGISAMFQLLAKIVISYMEAKNNGDV